MKSTSSLASSRKKERPFAKTTNATMTTIALSFDDYTDLQTRLVLLPRVEDEGIGAVVASYVASSSNLAADATDATTTTTPVVADHEISNNMADENAATTAVTTESINADGTIDSSSGASVNVRVDEPIDDSLVGLVLIEITTKEPFEKALTQLQSMSPSLLSMDFAEILASIRTTAACLSVDDSDCNGGGGDGGSNGIWLVFTAPENVLSASLSSNESRQQQLHAPHCVGDACDSNVAEEKKSDDAIENATLVAASVAVDASSPATNASSSSLTARFLLSNPKLSTWTRQVSAVATATATSAAAAVRERVALANAQTTTASTTSTSTLSTTVPEPANDAADANNDTTTSTTPVATATTTTAPLASTLALVSDCSSSTDSNSSVSDSNSTSNSNSNSSLDDEEHQATETMEPAVVPHCDGDDDNDTQPPSSSPNTTCENAQDCTIVPTAAATLTAPINANNDTCTDSNPNNPMTTSTTSTMPTSTPNVPQHAISAAVPVQTTIGLFVRSENGDLVALDDGKRRASANTSGTTGTNASTSPSPPVSASTSTSSLYSPFKSLALSLPTSALSSSSLPSSSLLVSSASHVSVRVSLDEPAPASWQYQWFKIAPTLSLSTVTISPAITPELNAKLNEGGSDGDNHDDWLEIAGATLSSFAPTATEIGYRLACRVVLLQPPQLPQPPPRSDNGHSTVAAATTIATADDGQDRVAINDTSSSSNDEAAATVDDNSNDNNNDALILYCDSGSAVVTASVPLLNGARQALVPRGAQFGGLVGLGNATGRTFGIKIQMSYAKAIRASFSNQAQQDDSEMLDKDDSLQQQKGRSRSSRKRSSTAVCSAITIYQVSGTTAEPMHPVEEPIGNVTAVAVCGHGTQLALILPPAVVEHDSMALVAALCTKDRRFLLQAPNRLARESMLLTIGIANFQGKPVDLTATSILYPAHNEDTCLSRRHASTESLLSSAADHSDRERLLSASTLGDYDSASVESSCSLSSSVSSSSSFENVGNENSAASTAPVGALNSQGHHSNASLGATAGVDFETSPVDVTALTMQANRELQSQVEYYRSKLVRKDKIISELQRQVEQSDKAAELARRQLASAQSESDRCQAENDCLKQSLTATKGQLEGRDQSIQQLKAELREQTNALRAKVHEHTDEMADMVRINRALMDDNQALQAGAAAQEEKLAKMVDLQASVNVATARLVQQGEIQTELDAASKRYAACQADLDSLRALYAERTKALDESSNQMAAMERKLQAEMAMAASNRTELEMEQLKIQKLKAERNSYKQKCDSIAKEMSRICRNGRTVRDVEKVLADETTRQEEVQHLREQKRQALEQVEHFRTAYGQSLGVQRLAGLDHDAGKLLERNAELERLLSGLTEYLNAKEMQLETMKQVNDTLQAEIRDLAKANMSKNDI